MQLIEGLTPLQQAGAAMAVILVLVLLVVSVRRRRAGETPAPAAAAAPKRSRQEMRKQTSDAAPRRKRRRLAAEAGMSMSAGSVSAPAVDEAAALPVEPAAFAGSPDAEEASEDDLVAVASPARTAASHDPPGLVADPGWPAPGELTTSFDPDAFDPLPEIEEREAHAGQEAAEPVDEQPTGVIEPMTAPIDETEAAYVEEYPIDDDFDPATGWADTEATAEPARIPVGANGEPVAELDHLWDEPEGEDEDSWDVAAEVAAVSAEVGAVNHTAGSDVELEPWGGDDSDEMFEEWSRSDVLETEPQVEREPEVDVQAEVEVEEQDEEAVELEDDHVEVSIEVRGTDSFPSFDSYDPVVVTPATGATIVEAPADEPLGFAEASVPAAAPVAPVIGAGHSPTGSPVVLDIAGLAGSGRAIELVIEPNGDGKGVRLRIGAAGDDHAQASAAEEAPATASDPGADVFPSYFRPFDEGAPVAEARADAMPLTIPAEAPPVVEEDIPAVAWPFPSVDGPDGSWIEEPSGHQVDEPVASGAAYDVPFLTGGSVDSTASVTPAEPAPAPPVEQPWAAPRVEVSDMSGGDVAVVFDGDGSSHAEPAEDPARILADIRARLAALDVGRVKRSS